MTKKKIAPEVKSRLMELSLNNLASPHFYEPDLEEEEEFDRLLRQARHQGLKLPKGSQFFLEEEDCLLCRDLLKQEVAHALGAPKTVISEVIDVGEGDGLEARDRGLH
jgi:hypothetical protein